MDKTISQTDVVNMCFLNNTFPVMPNVLIPRDSYLDLLDEQFENNKILCVQGSASGVGVTTVLAMFARRHANECASYFYDGFSRYLLNPRNVEDCLAKQLMCFLNDTQCSDYDNFIQLYSHKIRKKLNSSRKFLYFVFDDFDEIPKENVDTLKLLLSPLFCIENTRFLFSGDKKSIEEIIPAIYSVLQTNSILRFGNSDVDSFILSLFPELQSLDIDVFFKLSKGNAARLSILTEKYEKYKDIQYLERIYSNCVDDLFEDDFSYLNNSKDHNVIIFIELLTFSEILLNSETVIYILKIDNPELESITDYCKEYILINDNNYRIRSLQFRKYLSQKLNKFKNEIEMLQISALEVSTNMDLSFNNLPALYKNVNNKNALVRYLTSDNVQQYLVRRQSQAALNEQCEYGYYACTDFALQISDYFRFALIRSASHEIEKNELSDSEIEALISVGNVDEAYSLSQNVFLLEERLKCLLIIVRNGDKLSDSLKTEIYSQINQLVSVIDFEHIPEKAVELAKLMLPVDFVTSLTIIDKVAKVTKDKNQLDRLYAEISLSFNTESNSNLAESDKADILNTRISDEGIRKMAIAMKTIFADSDVSQVLSEIEKLPTPTSKLYFLRFWIPEHQAINHIEDAVLYAIRLVIATSNVSIPKVSFLVQFCMPLKNMKSEAVKEVISMLDAVSLSITYPTIDNVALRLSIIAALTKFDATEAQERLITLYLDISEFDDKSVAIYSKSLILQHFEDLGNKKDVEQYLMPTFKLQKEIINDIEMQLSKTAFHMKVVEGPIKALVSQYPSFVKDIIPKMNTEPRRSKAFLLALTEYVRQNDVLNLDWDYFNYLLVHITYDKTELSEPLILLALNLVSTNSDQSKVLILIKSKFSYFKLIDNETDKCYVFSKLFVWLKYHFPADDFSEKIVRQELEDSWDSINIQSVKVEVGYEIAKQLSKHLIQCDAKEYIKNTFDLRKNQLLSSSSCVSAYNVSLDLYCHSIGLLIRANLCENNDVEQLKTFLDYNNSEVESIIYWSKIALEFYLANDSVRFSKVMSTKVSMPLNKLSPNYQKIVIYHTSPSFFLFGTELFFDRINSFDDCFANNCLENVARFIVTKYPYLEENESSIFSSNPLLSYSDYDNLLKLIEHSRDECFIFNYTSFITDHLKQNQPNVLSKEQMSFILKRLETLVNNKLPLPNGISHNGYKIACNVAIQSLSDFKTVDWNVALQIDKDVNNIADQAFLYAAASHYAKKIDLRKKFLDAAIDKSFSIPSNFDKFNRLDMCISAAFEISQSQGNSIAKSVLTRLIDNHAGSYQEVKQIIDIVRDHNENLANDLLDLFDVDPARMELKKRLKKHLSSTRKIEDARNDLSKIKSLSYEEQLDFFESQLNALVNKKSICKDINSFYPVFNIIYDYPIADTKEAILFFMENLYAKHSLNHSYSALLRSVHNSLFYNLKLILAVSSDTKEKLEKINAIMGQSSAMSASSLIRAGQSEKGLDILNKWFNNHPFDILKIIDPYFSPDNLSLIKHFLDINNRLRTIILTRDNDHDGLNSYQKYWYDISCEMTGSVSIISVQYKDNIQQCPIHDRWWILYNPETKESFGLRLNSLNGIGNRDTEISFMDNDSIIEVNDLFSDYVSYKRPNVNGRSLEYETIDIK